MKNVIDVPTVARYVEITTSYSGYRTRQTCGFFTPGIHPVRADQWRDDSRKCNSLRVNTGSRLKAVVESRHLLWWLPTKLSGALPQ